MPDDVAVSTSAVAVFGFVHPKEGRREDLLREWQALTAPMRDEAGFEQYVIHTSDDESGAFFLYERWSSGPALVDHLQQEYMQAFFARLPQLLDRPFDGQWVVPVAA